MRRPGLLSLGGSDWPLGRQVPLDCKLNRVGQRGLASAGSAGPAPEGIFLLIPMKQYFCKALNLQSTLWASPGKAAQPGRKKVLSATDVHFQ